MPLYRRWYLRGHVISRDAMHYDLQNKAYLEHLLVLRFFMCIVLTQQVGWLELRSVNMAGELMCVPPANHRVQKPFCLILSNFGTCIVLTQKHTQRQRVHWRTFREPF